MQRPKCLKSVKNRCLTGVANTIELPRTESITYQCLRKKSSWELDLLIWSSCYLSLLCVSIIFFNVVSPNPYFPLGDLTVEVFVLIAGIFLRRSQKSANPVISSMKPTCGMQIGFLLQKKARWHGFPSMDCKRQTQLCIDRHEKIVVESCEIFYYYSEVKGA